MAHSVRDIGRRFLMVCTVVAGVFTLDASASAAAKCKRAYPFPKPYSKQEVVECFHPEGGTAIAVYGKWSCAAEDSADLGDDDLDNCTTCSMEIDKGKATLSGHLEYSGVLTKKKHTMRFVIELKRVTKDKNAFLYTRLGPTSDTAPIAANQDCWMRDWTLWQTFPAY